MTKRRRLLWLAAGLALVLLGGYAVLWPTGPAPGVTPENFHRFRAGDARHRAERILGEPWLVERGDASKAEVLHWRGERVEVSLQFKPADDREQRLTRGWMTRLDTGETEDLPAPKADGLLDKLRRWLGITK